MTATNDKRRQVSATKEIKQKEKDNKQQIREEHVEAELQRGNEMEKDKKKGRKGEEKTKSEV